MNMQTYKVNINIFKKYDNKHCKKFHTSYKLYLINYSRVLKADTYFERLNMLP